MARPRSAPAGAPKVPKMLRLKSRNLARVKVHGKLIYLGKWGSSEARAAYGQVVADVLAGRPVTIPTKTAEPASAHTVGELVQRYLTYARGYYLKQGRPTSEVHGIEAALSFLDSYSGVAADTFRAADLRLVRDEIVAYRSTNKHRKGKPLDRTTVNKYVSRIARAFRWGSVEGLVSAEVAAGLAMLPGLRAGRTVAPDAAPVLPVSDADVEAAVAKMPAGLAAMVKLQRLTGMRPGEVCGLRPADLDQTNEVWLYTPRTHKTEHRGKSRTIFIGPQGQAILAPYLAARGATEFCFRPDRQPFVRMVERRYSVETYRQAIRRACVRAKVTPWRPNQLRHAAATEARKLSGLEGAQLMLGHARVSMTQHYAEVNTAKGIELAKRHG